MDGLTGFTWSPSTALHGQSFWMLRSVPRPGLSGLDSRNGSCHQKRLHLVGWFIFFQMSRWMSEWKDGVCETWICFCWSLWRTVSKKCIRVLILSWVKDDICLPLYPQDVSRRGAILGSCRCFGAENQSLHSSLVIEIAPGISKGAIRDHLDEWKWAQIW